MTLNEKLQALRKQKNLTQEEVAQALYVSRTAVSKWESGRGAPSIDSLMAIARFFGVTVDGLLTGDDVLTLAKAEVQQTRNRLCDVVFGLLDVSCLLFFLLPLLKQPSGAGVAAVSLMQLTELPVYLKAAYFAAVGSLILWGVLTLALQTAEAGWWQRWKGWVSLSLNTAGVLLFIGSSQPYGAALLFVNLLIKGFLMVQRR
ncbi:MAG: helix-turn-helix transcriptional regulator [Clostridia bacterium]|nr:helix-turn-helix transcriptional regulator [Clostridia bacterium]